MKAIETIYKNYRFRSRLEARWAVFFDTLGVEWEYEVEGFELDGIRYLPDFWLPQQKQWVEVKGQQMTPQEWEKCGRFYKTLDRDTGLFIAMGNIPFLDEKQPIYNHIGVSERQLSRTPDDLFLYCGWAECPYCNKVAITIDCNTRSICDCFKEIGIAADNLLDKFTRESSSHKFGVLFSKLEKLYVWGNTPRLIEAYAAARSARFEHGETPN